VDSAVITIAGPNEANTPALGDTTAKPAVETTSPTAMMTFSKNMKPG